jgi:prepilin-type N-terminal cleavage/methylation domain-containing protein
MATRIQRLKLGVTFVELIMVISLIGILAAIATPRYAAALQEYQAEAAADRIKEDLNMARRRASIMGKNVDVIFNTVTNSYHLTNVESLDSRQQSYQINLAAPPFYAAFYSVSFPGGIGGSSQVVFDYYGAPDSSGSVVVKCGDATRTVLLNPPTWEASVQ